MTIKLVTSDKDTKTTAVVPFSGNSREPFTPRELTAKQEAFCRYVAEGESLIGAYRKAGYSENGSETTIRGAIHKLRWQNSRVIQRITQLREQKEKASLHDAGQTAAFVLNGLMAEASNAEARPMERLKALELLGKVTSVGLFSERIEQQTTIKSDDKVISELEAKLQKLVG